MSKKKDKAPKIKGYERHHIIPRSRGGDSDLENICYVSKVEHNKYHSLFANRTPTEIIQYLDRYFWTSSNLK